MTALAAAGAVAVLMGLAVALPFVLAALVLAVAQRSRLARAIRTPVPDRRRHRFRLAGGLAGVTLVALASYVVDLSDEQISTLSLILHNAVGVPAMVGAAAYALMAFLTPREPRHQTS